MAELFKSRNRNLSLLDGFCNQYFSRLQRYIKKSGFSDYWLASDVKYSFEKFEIVHELLDKHGGKIDCDHYQVMIYWITTWMISPDRPLVTQQDEDDELLWLCEAGNHLYIQTSDEIDFILERGLEEYDKRILKFKQRDEDKIKEVIINGCNT